MSGKKTSATILFYMMVQGALFSQAVNSSVVFQNRLSIPPLLNPGIENGEKVFTLTLQKGEKEFCRGNQRRHLESMVHISDLLFAFTAAIEFECG